MGERNTTGDSRDLLLTILHCGHTNLFGSGPSPYLTFLFTRSGGVCELMSSQTLKELWN